LNFLFAIVLLFAFPGTSAAIRRGQVKADTSDLDKGAHRQLSGAGDGGGEVMGMKVNSNDQ
jgi:hypothetical protein